MRAIVLIWTIFLGACHEQALPIAHDGGASNGDDAGAAIPPSQTPLQSDPGFVACGATACALHAGAPMMCCVANQEHVQSCVDTPGLCESGTKFSCDEAADCAAGQRCCFGGRSFGGSWCTSDACAPSSCASVSDCRAELCKTNEECPGGRCYAYDCVNGRRIGSCAPLDAEHLRALECN